MKKRETVSFSLFPRPSSPSLRLEMRRAAVLVSFNLARGETQKFAHTKKKKKRRRKKEKMKSDR